jgi:hypothetical protein
MCIHFYDYCGEAGNEHLLLVGVDENGNKHSVLYNRFYFANFNRKRAERKIRRMFQV